MKSISVKCDCCDGNGEVKLSAPLSETLAIITRHPGCTSSFIFTQLKKRFDRSFVNQRLKKLAALKLIVSKKEHRCLRTYSPVIAPRKLIC